MARINPSYSNKWSLRAAVRAGLRVVPYEDPPRKLSKDSIQKVKIADGFVQVEIRWDETGPYIAKVVS